MLGDKLKGRAFCQVLYMEFVYSPKHAYMEITKEKRTIVLPQLPYLPQLPQLPQLPISASPRPRVPVSGASLDNDTFTLTCYQ
ncbi:MAG: hypothetical protein F6K31_16540 [Symploca sp. SIO2G7]|nr:hypothetical protein [Symploca sp. SIO2G7]